MTAVHEQGSIKRFWQTAWKFQRTLETPLKALDPFVAAIFSTLSPNQSAKLIVDGCVFEPKTLRTLLKANSLNMACTRDDCVVADTPAEVADLLRAALADWLDFAFVPSPKPFVIYADHDEYITFFGNTKSSLKQVVNVLCDRGFKEVLEYKRFR